ncbi:hypothetical protein [Coraliomargarita parva]|uniref:hypothetical protein n=1 Tax=Coraliomargarita parva TaxID=3014050 RepID=UPI0022B561EC|nr:hypothetical protein [Coraliomargarita parva]
MSIFKHVSTLTAASACLFLSTYQSSHAELIAYEGFEDYNPGDGLAGMTSTNGGTGWSSAFSVTSTGGGFPSATRNIDYSNGSINVDGGNTSYYSTGDNSNYYLNRTWSGGVDLTQGSGNALYVSFLWQTRTGESRPAGDGTTNSFFQVIFSESTSTNTYFYGVINRFVTDDHYWQARYNNVANTGPSSTSDQVYMVVMKLESGSISLYLNPNSNSEGSPTVTQTGVQLTGTNWDSVDTISFRQAVGASNWNIDEIRIGTSFADVIVVPEVSSFAAVLGLLSLGLVINRRRASS